MEKTSCREKMERNLWRDGEIKALLNIINKNKILDMINEKKFKNEQIFRFVESEMHNRGFTKKNYQQIWTKWKFLKSSYVTTTRHNSMPGNMPRTCDYYNLLDRILRNGNEKSNGASSSSVDSGVGSSNSPPPPCPIISSVQSGVIGLNGETIGIKQEVIDEPENDPIRLIEPEPTLVPLLNSTPIISELTNGYSPPPPPLSKQKRKLLKGKRRVPPALPPTPRIEVTTEPLSYNDEMNGIDGGDGGVGGGDSVDPDPDEPSSKRKHPQGSYFRAMKELANSLRQMQRELVDEFFRKQEELMHEEHAFQKRQDDMLLKSFEEQTRLLLDGARNLLSNGMSEMPDIVYINED